MTKEEQISRLKEEVAKIIGFCDSRTDFFKKFKHLYLKCLEYKIMDEVCSHMVKHNSGNGKHGNRKISDAQLYEHAASCKTRTEFKNIKSGSYYHMARKRGIIDDVCKHMVPAANLTKRFIYAFENKDKTAYIGLSYDPEKRKAAHLRLNKQIIDRISGQVFKIIEGPLSAQEAAKKEIFYIEKYRQDGWTVLNKRKGGELGTPKKISKEQCLYAALKFSRRIDFMNFSSVEYTKCQREGWIDEVCAHMGRPSSKKWLDQEIADEAAKHPSRYAFKVAAPGMYKAARDRGILDIVCAHAPPKNKKLTNEQILQEASKYSSVKEWKKKGKYISPARARGRDFFKKCIESMKKYQRYGIS